MREELKQALQGVIAEWRKPLPQFEDIINRTDLSEDQIVNLLKEVMAEATGDAFVALKMAHVLLLD